MNIVNLIIILKENENDECQIVYDSLSCELQSSRFISIAKILVEAPLVKWW